MFDLDHTLIRRDSFAGFNRMLLTREWWRAAIVCALAPLLAPLWISASTRSGAAGVLLWVATAGLRPDHFQRLLRHYVEEITRDLDALVYHEGVAQVHRHLRAGDRVVIVTGAMSTLAETLCDRIGLTGVEIVGSTIRPCGPGLIGHRHCYGARKLEMLAEVGVAPPWTDVYTDSASDLPILRHGTRRHLVNPTPAVLKRVTRDLGSDFRVVRWA